MEIQFLSASLAFAFCLGVAKDFFDIVQSPTPTGGGPATFKFVGNAGSVTAGNKGNCDLTVSNRST